MNIFTIILLFVFNVLVWGVILSRLVDLARSTTRSVAVIFAVGMLFQGIHSVILPFSWWFEQFFPGRLVNFVEIGCSIVSAFFLYLTASLFWDYAISVEDNELLYQLNITFNLKRHTRVLFVGMIIALMAALVFELIILGDLNDTLTPSSTDIKQQPLLLLSRFFTMTYIIVAELVTAYVFVKLGKTSYGKYHSIRVKAAFVSIVTHSSHFAANLLVTIILFFLSPEHPLSAEIHSIYLIFDTFILIPLGLSFFVAIGPNWLIEKLDQSVSLFQFLQHRKNITWLRNLLIEYYPTVQLVVSIDSFSVWRPFRKVRYEISRYIIECSDALHLLVQDVAKSSGVNIRPVYGKSALLKDPCDEARLIAESIRKTQDNQSVSPEMLNGLFDLSLFGANSLRELMQIYAGIARCLKKENIL
ncbi:hypothetical protein KC950_04415 [Candidatus Saccharibacteria bacterium]|nr:hypothetical protein [Candidatus Saccharibacteria bacterium]